MLTASFYIHACKGPGIIITSTNSPVPGVDW